MILVTTGRNPTQNTRRLCKELVRIIPKTRRLVRGKLGLRQLPDELTAAESDRMIMVYRGFAGPGQLEFIKLQDNHLMTIPPTILIKSVTFEPSKKRHSSKVECITASSEDGLRLAEVFSRFLELPLVDHAKARALSISVDAGRVLRIAPTHLRIGEIEGFTLVVKKLMW